MTVRVLLLLIVTLVLQGCGTVLYNPTEYPLRDGLVPAFNASGDASFNNAQNSTTPAIVYSYGGTKFQSNYQEITQLMATQATKEFAKRASVSSGPPKTISLKVTSLQSRYIAFFWKSTLHFEATFGNGEIIQKDVAHSSGDVIQDLNGCIAEAVWELYKDPKVMAYIKG